MHCFALDYETCGACPIRKVSSVTSFWMTQQVLDGKSDAGDAKTVRTQEKVSFQTRGWLTASVFNSRDCNTRTVLVFRCADACVERAQLLERFGHWHDFVTWHAEPSFVQ